MSKSEFLNFSEISQAVQFRDLLDALNIPYTEKNGELKGDGFIVNIAKNLFFSPQNANIKGSPINFLAYHKNIELREAATELKRQFLSKKDMKPKRNMPDLQLEWDPYIQERGISPEIAKQYEIGFVKQRSIMAGRIAFKIYDCGGKHIGYIGYKTENGSWHYPQGFKRPLYNTFRLRGSKSLILTIDPFDALKIASLGLLNISALLSPSMSEEQEKQLKQFKYILLLHKEPENIVNRLYKTSFIKAPILSKPIKEMSDHEMLNIIKPSH